MKSSLDNCNYNSLGLKEIYAENIFSENKNIPNVLLQNSSLEEVLLSSVIGDSTKLIYLFFEETCVQCVEDELDIVKQLADNIGADNIIIISDFTKMNRLKSIIFRKQIKSPYFIYKKKFNLAIENKQEVASFFLLNKDLQTQFVYKAGGDQDIEDPYYKRIIDFFKIGY